MDTLPTFIIISIIVFSLLTLIGEVLAKPYKERQNQIKAEENNQIEKYKKLNKELEEKIQNAPREAQKIIERATSERDMILQNAEKEIKILKNEAKNEVRERFFLPIKPVLSSLYNFDAMYYSTASGRLNNAFESDLSIKDFAITATIKSGDHYYKNVSLNHCDCQDFQIHKKPCKHILFLAYTMGVLQTNQEFCQKHKDTLVEEIITQSNNKKAIEHEIYLLNRRKDSLTQKTRIQEEALKVSKENISELEEILSMKAKSIPHMASLIADWKELKYEQISHELKSKKRPAITAAQTVSELKKEIREVTQSEKELKYKLTYIEKLFPNINDIFDDGFQDESFELETEENTDRVRLFLSHEEYSSLSTSEKNQLALDRYIERRKSKWQIGRDYEMYIGYLCEKNGWLVQYTGIIKNLEDMGRDLIVSNGQNTFIIQCKNWSQEKTIHEKHIFQLFGSTVQYNIENHVSAKPIFVSTASLSAMAKRVAEELGVDVKIAQLGEFPRIKCNVNRTTGEKIYHLPFDQQYDNVIIEKEKGECYTFTVKEAEEKGFRRAFKHFASQ